MFNEERHPRLRSAIVGIEATIFLKKARDETNILKLINVSASSEKPIYRVPLTREEWLAMVIPLKYSSH